MKGLLAKDYALFIQRKRFFLVSVVIAAGGTAVIFCIIDAAYSGPSLDKVFSVISIGGITALAVAVSAVVMAVSMIISIRIMEKKGF